jgi:hypothetical protein
VDPFQPIAGVSLEQYATLCAAMMHTGEDTAAQAAIAAEHGVAAADWQAAQQGWTARFSDPANQGKVAHAFYPLYQAAQARNRGGAEPMSLAQYARITAEYSFEKDAAGKQIDHQIVLARYGLNSTTWGEVTGYWTPKVNDPADPAAAEFRALVQAESDRILGIDRGGGGPAPKPAAAAPSSPKPAAAAPSSPKPAAAAQKAEKPKDLLDQLADFLNGLLKM